jgi:hypothetical protein
LGFLATGVSFPSHLVRNRQRFGTGRLTHRTVFVNF